MAASLTRSLAHSLLASSCALLALAGRVQGQSGAWLNQPFNHEHATATATDALYPFTNPPPWPPTFNAVHMSVIPVGHHRGRVLVWDAGLAIGYATPFTPANPGVLWSFQRYAIVDPNPNATTRFYNYLLPMGPTTTSGADDLFCSGHAWSSFGYLVVAGGTEHVLVGGTFLDYGADLVYTFDPRFDNAPFPGFATPLYSAAPGTHWRDELRLRVDRYYPTVTLTRRFNRPAPFVGGPTFVEIGLVTGGSDDPQQGSHFRQPEWYSYEALVLVDAPSATAQRVYTDVMNGFDQWWGPIDPNTPTDPAYPIPDGFHEYPRVHFLSNDRVFHAGGIAPSAQVDHSFTLGSTTPAGWTPPNWVQRWDTSTGTPGPSSQFRHAGSSAHFARIGSFNDLVVRMGGRNAAFVPTLTCELCFAGVPGSWFGPPSVPNLTIERVFASAVILPDGSIFVVGGDNASGAVLIPELYRWGTGQWTRERAHVSPRAYHSTAVLLDDGSVLVGGGNSRTWDYEIYLPPYMSGTPPPMRPTGVSLLNPSYTDPYGTPVLFRPTGLPVSGFNVECDNDALDFVLGKIVLLTPGSITHSSDMHQRFFECTVTQVTPTMVQFTTPSESQAPRGYYRLFALSTAGIPSKALWVKLE